MSRSAVAVVIGCRALGRALAGAVESALAQTAPPDEVIVVDRASGDTETAHVLAALELEHPCLRVIREPSAGAAHAYNRGIASAAGPLVALLDGADRFEPEYLEQAADLLDSRPDLSYACCAAQWFGAASHVWRPPPHTVAGGLGRGVCGHDATVLRRALWVELGGFDETLPAYDGADFWLRALAHGARGAIIDRPLVRLRVPSPRREPPLHPDEQVRAKRVLLEKHLALAEPRGEDVFAELLGLEHELAEEAAGQQREHAAVRTALALAEAELAAAREATAAAGAVAFDWGRLAVTDGGGDAPAGDAGETVEQRLVAEAIARLAPSPHPRRTLILVPGAGAGAADAGSRARFDLVVAAGMLEREADPERALARWRGLLADGGRLVVAASTLALGEESRRGWTEAALRELICAAFDPARVRVECFGNLMSSLASVAGAAAAELTEDELAAVDPRCATVVAASARLAPRRRRRQRAGTRTEPTQALPPRRGAWYRKRGAILCYDRLAVSSAAELFAAQMELVAERCRPMALLELAARAPVGDLPPGAVAVTFDGAWPEQLDVSAPILSELGIPATVFVDPSAPRDERLADEQLVELRDAAGHELGTVGFGSAQLERLLGEPVRAIAYPRLGGADRHAADRARSGGFAAACTGEPGVVTCDSDPLRLPRIAAGERDVESLALLLERTLGGLR